jgi:mutator protein MutT
MTIKKNRVVSGIILLNKDSVLLQLRSKDSKAFPNHYCVPGGKLEIGESVKEAAIRELNEETGYISSDPEFFSIDKHLILGDLTIDQHLFYDIYDNKQEIKCFEGQKVEFVKIADLCNIKMVPKQKEHIEKLFKLVNKE